MSQRSSPRSPSPNWGGLSRNLALWALVAVLGLVLYRFVEKQRSATAEISYTLFSHELDKSNIAKIEIVEGKVAKGSFSVPVQKDGATIKNFTVLFPMAN